MPGAADTATLRAAAVRPDYIGLGGLLGAEIQAGLGRGVLLVAGPWWLSEQAGGPWAGIAVVVAGAFGWLLARRGDGSAVPASPWRASWGADCAVALLLTVLLVLGAQAAWVVVAAAAAVFVLARLQEPASAARAELVPQVAVDAHVDAPRVRRWLALARRWAPLAGLAAGLALGVAWSPTAMVAVALGLFLQACEFVFVAVPRAAGHVRRGMVAERPEPA